MFKQTLKISNTNRPMEDFFLSLRKLKLTCRTESPRMLSTLQEVITCLKKIQSEHVELLKNQSLTDQNIEFPEPKAIAKFRTYFQTTFQRSLSKPRLTFSTLSSERMIHTSDTNLTEYIDAWLDEIKQEIQETCHTANTIIDDLLTEPTFFADAESRAFFFKMKADYYRYVFEVSDNNNEGSGGVSENSKQFYERAIEISNDLHPTNPVRLGAALNYSVLLYEDLDMKGKALEVANEAFSLALKNAEHMERKDFKESALLMQLIKDNVTLWNESSSEGGAGMGVGDKC